MRGKTRKAQKRGPLTETQLTTSFQKKKKDTSSHCADEPTHLAFRCRLTRVKKKKHTAICCLTDTYLELKKKKVREGEKRKKPKQTTQT